jgi:endopolyphosphatase
VFEYNTSGLEPQSEGVEPIPLPASFEYDDADADADADASGKKKKKKKKKHRKYKFTVPDGPSETAPPGPAYSPQTLSLLKYTQYFANLTYINNDFSNHTDAEDEADGNKWSEGKHKGKKPHDDKDHDPNPKKFKYEKLYDTKEDKVYALEDLTMRSLVGLARRIGDFVAEDDSLESISEGEVQSEGKGKKHKKKHKGKKGKKKHSHRKGNEAWYTFVRRAYVETLSQDEIDDQFGGE